MPGMGRKERLQGRKGISRGRPIGVPQPRKARGPQELLAVTVSKQRAFDLIVVHKLDRLFRDTLESSTARAILKKERVRLISVTEPMVGSDTPEIS